MWQIWDIMGHLSVARHLLDGMAQWSLEADTASFNALIVGSDGSRLVRKEKEWGTAEPGGTEEPIHSFCEIWSQNDSEKVWVPVYLEWMAFHHPKKGDFEMFRAPMMNADYAVSCGNPLGNGVRVVDEYFRPFVQILVVIVVVWILGQVEFINIFLKSSK